MAQKRITSHSIIRLVLGLTASTLIIAIACTPGAKATAIADSAKVAICVAENQDLPTEAVIAKCLIENVTPKDIERMLEAQKAATEKAAAKKASACGKPSTDGGK
jgi:hypothetical protein